MGTPAGVMDSSYAADRLRKPHLRFRFRTRALAAFQAFRKHGNGSKAPTVVDFGAAEGLTLLELRALFQERGQFTGIEYAADLIAKAPTMPVGAKLIQGDVTHLPAEIAAESCDLVTALALLEHLGDPVQALREARRVLRPGGLFVASCPAPQWDAISTKLGLMKGEHHESHLDGPALRRLVERSGLTFCEYRPFMFAPVSFVPYLKLSVPVGPAFALDGFINALPLTGWTFVNQLIVARKS